MTARKAGASPRIMWTDEARAKLAAMFEAGKSDRQMAVALRGTPAAVRVQRLKQGLSREQESPIAAARSRHLRAIRAARQVDPGIAAGDVDALGIDDDEMSPHELIAACAEMGRRIEAAGVRFEDVVRRVV
jgi:hypothetical protein